jgi:hypothetical protein
MIHQGMMLALSGKPGDEVQMISAGIDASRATGATLWRAGVIAFLSSGDRR